MKNDIDKSQKADTAIHWFIRRMNKEEWTEKDEHQFQIWLTDSAENRIAYDEIHGIHHDLGRKEIFPAAEFKRIMKTANLPLVENRSCWKSICVLIGQGLFLKTGFVIASQVMLASLLVFGLIAEDCHRSFRKVAVTAVGEQKTIIIPGQSRVVMDTNTNLAIEIRGYRRRVNLISGRAIFEVSHDPKRPFEVDTGNGLVRVLGTQFSVFRHNNQTEVKVLEGSVDFISRCPDNESATRKVQVDARQRALLTKAGCLLSVETIEETQFGSWREGRLVFRDRPLAHVVREVNRYFHEEIHVVDDTIANERISGSFDIQNIDEFLIALEHILPLRIRWSEGVTIAIEPINSIAVD